MMLYTGAVEPDGRWPRREQVTWAVENSVKAWLSAAGIEHRKVHPLEEPSGRRQGVRGRDLPGTRPQRRTASEWNLPLRNNTTAAPPRPCVNANLILSVFANLKLTHFLLIAQQKCPV